MLIEPGISDGCLHARPKQAGVVLVIALIVLVAMTLAGLALMRSVDTSNIIAGNLAFQQSTVYSSSAGTEAGIAWLEANNTGSILQGDNVAQGYRASRQDPDPLTNQSWDNFWAVVLANQASAPFVDAAGNTVTYAIQRLCFIAGSTLDSGVGCTRPTALPTSATSVGAGSSMETGIINPYVPTEVLYRITSRITGPRNTVSYVQTIVAM